MACAQVTTALFSDLDLNKNTQAAISDVLGYANMTKVQAQSIPVCLTGERRKLSSSSQGTAEARGPRCSLAVNQFIVTKSILLKGAELEMLSSGVGKRDCLGVCEL